ncbi:MAG: shikimate kinase, partial [Chloroflexota bacterium]
VGLALAEHMGLAFVETDAMIEERAGMTIAEIFDRKGEAAFRELESEVVREVSVSKGAVIACGGGVPLRDDNVEALRDNTVVVYLDVTAEKVIDRLGPPSNLRPLLSGPDREEHARELLAARRPQYVQAADIVVDSDELTVEQIVTTVDALLKDYERTHSQE